MWSRFLCNQLCWHFHETIKWNDRIDRVAARQFHYFWQGNGRSHVPRRWVIRTIQFYLATVNGRILSVDQRNTLTHPPLRSGESKGEKKKLKSLERPCGAEQTISRCSIHHQTDNVQMAVNDVDTPSDSTQKSCEYRVEREWMSIEWVNHDDKMEKEKRKTFTGPECVWASDWDQLMLIGNNHYSMEHANRFLFLSSSSSLLRLLVADENIASQRPSRATKPSLFVMKTFLCIWIEVKRKLHQTSINTLWLGWSSVVSWRD